MQNTFDIQFAQGTPEIARQPRAGLDVNLGGQAIGNAVARFGEKTFAIGQKIQLAQDAMDLSILNQTGEKMDMDAELTLSKITDSDEQEKFIQTHEQNRANIAAKSNSRVQNAYQINYKNTSVDRLRRFYSIGIQTRAKDANDKFKFARQTAIDNGNLLEVHKIDKFALDTENIGPEQYKVLTDSAPIDIAFSRARKDLVTNPVDVINRLSSTEFTSKLNPEQLQANDQLLSIARKQTGVVAGESNKQLTDLFGQKKLTLADVQDRREQLTDTDYQAWTKIALNPADKRGNVIKTTELKSQAMDVWRGTFSREQTEQNIRASLADPNGINDEQYAAIYADLDREVKGYQAQDIKAYSMRAAQLILGKDAGVMSFDAFGNISLDMTKLLSPQADFEKKMHFIDLYQEEMNQYLADNPKASKKELYIKSQELKETYLRASKGTITGTTARADKMEVIVEIGVDDKAKWEFLPPGQKFRGPDGKVRVK
jgi:hypothetical protein